MFFLLFLCWRRNDFFEFYLFFWNLSFENVERFGNFINFTNINKKYLLKNLSLVESGKAPFFKDQEWREGLTFYRRGDFYDPVRIPDILTGCNFLRFDNF